MALIANLAVGLTANTRAFSTRMAAAVRPVQRFAAAVDGARGRTLAFFGALSAAATGGALALWTKSTIEQIDNTAKLADRIGTTTEQLTGLQYAAKLAGVENESLGKSLEGLARRLGQGGTEVEEGLRRIGLEAGKLLGRGPAEQFAEIADGVKRLALQEDRAAVATALFGRQGIELLNVLALGRDGLAAASEEARRLGLAYSRIDAAKVEAAGDAIEKVKMALQGAFNALVIKAAPFLEALSNRLVALATQGKGLGGILVAAFDGVARAIEGILSLFNDFDQTVLRTQATVLRMANTFAKLSGVTLFESEEKLGLLSEAQALEQQIADKQLTNTGPSLSERFRNEMLRIEEEASIAAARIAADAAASQARALQEASRRATATKILSAVLAGAGALLPYVNALVQGSVQQAAQERLAKQEMARRLNEAFDPRADIVAGLQRTAVEVVAATGTAGTFAGETAGRIAAQVTMEQQQLDQLTRVADTLEEVRDTLDGGVPLSE